MALDDKGLMDQTLQEGYKKLLISEKISGIETGMSKISTSVGTNIAGSALYMGFDVQETPSVKIKGFGDGKPFFYIENTGGYDNMTSQSNYPNLTAFAASATGGKNGIIKVHNILNIDSSITTTGDQTADSMSGGQIVFGNFTVPPPDVDSNTKTWSGGLGSIFTQGSNIQHRLTGSPSAAWWQFDRLKIGNSLATNLAFECEADQALFAGLKTTAMMRPTHSLVSTGTASSGIQTSDDIHLRGSMASAGSSINLVDTPRVNIEARYDSGQAILNLNSVSKASDPQQSLINIGITDDGGTAPYSNTLTREYQWNDVSSDWDSVASELQGPTTINIGQPSPKDEIDATATNRQTLNLNSGTVKLGGKTSLLMPYVASDAGSWRPDNYSWQNDANSIYFIQDASVSTDVKLMWFDGLNQATHQVEAVNHTVGRTTRMSKVTTAIDPLSTEGNIYIKGGKLIVAYNDPLGDAAGTGADILYYWVDLTHAVQTDIDATTQDLTAGWKMSYTAP